MSTEGIANQVSASSLFFFKAFLSAIDEWPALRQSVLNNDRIYYIFVAWILGKVTFRNPYSPSLIPKTSEALELV